MTNTINLTFGNDSLLKCFKKVRVRYLICFILSLPLLWLGFQAVQEYWSQPLTTGIVYENLVNDYKVIFPLITFSLDNFYQFLHLLHLFCLLFIFIIIITFINFVILISIPNCYSNITQVFNRYQYSPGSHQSSQC